MIIDFKTATSPEDVVTVVASPPLTINKNWHKMKKSSPAVFEKAN